MNNIRIVIAFAFFAVAAAGLIEYPQPRAYVVKTEHKDLPLKLKDHHDIHYVAPVAHKYDAYNYDKEPFDYPKYRFEYGVKDEHTGDHKSQWEERDGDVVKGEYTLEEADGTHRVVEYHADDKTGFNAVVKKIGHAHHPQVYKHHEEPHYEY